MANSRDGLRLETDELHLLEVDRSSSRSDTRLTFRLRRHPRTPTLPYTAISYAWGNEASTDKIVIDEHGTSVTRNLWCCLLNVYHHTDWLFVWVDALCINQADHREKSAQVLEMARTYRDAELVAAWLGNVHEITDADALNSLHRPIGFAANEGVFSTYEWPWKERLVQLAGRPYWTRRWIAQELFHARRIEIFCGPHRIPWTQFRLLLIQIEATYTQLRGPLTIATILQNQHSRSASPLSILVNLRHLECKDIRDRIFALVSLFPTSDRESFVPDYSKDYEDVVDEFMHRFVSRESHDEIGQHIAHIKEAFGSSPRSELPWTLRKRIFATSMPYDFICYMGAFPGANGVEEWYSISTSSHLEAATHDMSRAKFSFQQNKYRHYFRSKGPDCKELEGPYCLEPHHEFRREVAARDIPQANDRDFHPLRMILDTEKWIAQYLSR